MNKKLVQLDLPNDGQYKNDIYEKCNQSLQLVTDVGLVLSPCTKYIAWWNRNLLLIYDGPNVLMARKGFDISFLLWNADGSRILIICKRLDEDGTNPVFLLDFKTGEIKASGKLTIDSEIVGCFWFENENGVSIISQDCVVILAKIYDSKIFAFTALSFSNTFKLITSYLVIADNIYIFGTSKTNNKSLMTIWKSSDQSPHFFSNHGCISSPYPISNGIFNRFWRIVFGKPIIGIAEDAVLKSCRFIKGFATLSKNGFLSYFSSQNELMWSRNIKQRFNLETSDEITDISPWNEDCYIISTTSGKIFRDFLSNSSNEPFIYQFSLKTIYAIAAICNDRIYIHDHFLKVFLEYSPEEMLESHMINHQYEEAYELAVKFNLNTDDVMKAKWKDSIELNNWDISILERIKDRKWVLEQCKQPPFPNSYILIKKMINYGLSLSSHISAKAIEDELERVFEKLESSSSSPSTQVPISVMEFYMYRVQFLRRLDLLCTFEAIHMNETLKNDSGLDLGKRFADFLKTSLIDFAISQADDGSISNLKILFTRHGSKLLPYRLSLLQRLPLTISPFDMEAILPSLQKWYEIPWRKSDWAEAKDLVEFVSLIQENDMNTRLELTSYPASLEETKEWYIKRIDRLINETGQIAFARSLCEMASSKGIDLGSLTLNLGLLECARKNIEYQAISLTDLHKIPPEKILRLVISSCDLENTSFLLSNILYPYLMTSNTRHSYIKELQEGLLELCLKDLKFLHLILAVGFTNPSLVDFLSIPFLIQKCAYREDTMFDLDFWQQIVDDFEKHKYETSTTSEGWREEDWSLEIEDCHSSLDNFKDVLQDLSDYVKIAVFFNTHGIFWNLSQIQQLKTENSRPLLSKILRQSKLLLNANDQTWNDSLHSILHFVRQGLFNQVSENSVYTEYVVYAFSQAKFQFVQQIFFPKSGACPLSSENIELLSLNAAIEYFDNDQEGNRSKGLMKLSRTCCTLLKPTIKSIKNHLDLIDATDILVGQYNIMNDTYTNVLPIQIRLHKDRIQFLKMLLLKNPELYRKKDWLFDLLKKLVGDIAAVSLRSRYLFDIYSAQAALQLNSFDDSFKILTEISEKSLNSDLLQADELEMFWTVVEKLVTSSYNNLEGKLVLISSAVAKSTAFNVSALLPAWRKTYVMSKFQTYPNFTGKPPIEVYTLLQQNLNAFLGAELQVDFSGILKRNHDFYQPVGSFIGDFYSERKAQELDERFEITNASRLVHLISLLDQLEESRECDLKALFPTLLAEDISLAFSYMMSSRLDAEALSAIFDELTANSTSYSLAVYFFSLKACLLIPRELFSADPFSLSFNELPEVAFSVIDTIPQNTNEFKEISQLINAAKVFSEKTKSSKVFRLREILVSLLDADPERVQTDEEYRIDKIIELGRTNVWKTLERATELAKEEGIPLSKIWVAHALWLFSSENNGPDINYQDSKLAIFTYFSAFEPHVSSLHSDLIESGSGHLSRFYSLLQEALIERKIEVQYSLDASQLSIRLEILNELEARGIRKHIMMKQLLESKASGLDGYMKIWIDFGDYIGYQNFINLLDKSTLLAPIHFLDESFANEQQDNIEFKSQVISKCVLHCISHQPWDSLDSFSINSILEDAFQTFPSMIPQHVEELVLSILSETKFEIKTRELILTHAFPFAIHSERLGQQRDLVHLLINLEHARDAFGNQIPKNVIDMIDTSFCKNEEMLKNNLMELCLSDFSPKLMETICTEANMNCLEIYDNAIEISLLEENRIGVEILLLALKPFETQVDFEFENNDSWGIDDEFVVEGEIDQFIADLKSVIFERLEQFSLQETASHSFKIEILQLLEKYYATKGSDISHLQDAKLESMILANWDIKIEDRSLSSLFPLVLSDTSTPIQCLQLFELLRDWPEPVENEVWIKAFTKLYELGYIDLIIALQAFSRVGSNEIEVEVQKHVLELLSTKQPFTNHYFLYGLLSSQRKVQNHVLNNFDQIHPNHNSYQITYRVACCLGFFTILSKSHQEECIQSVLQFQEDFLSLPLLGIILSEYPGTTIPICRSWTGMSKGVLRGYSRWIDLESKLIKESLMFWDSSISRSIESINQPRDSICHSVALRQLDQDKLFTLIVADRLGQAKKRIAEYQHEY